MITSNQTLRNYNRASMNHWSIFGRHHFPILQIPTVCQRHVNVLYIVNRKKVKLYGELIRQHWERITSVRELVTTVLIPDTNIMLSIGKHNIVLFYPKKAKTSSHDYRHYFNLITIFGFRCLREKACLHGRLILRPTTEPHKHNLNSMTNPATTI